MRAPSVVLNIHIFIPPWALNFSGGADYIGNRRMLTALSQIT